jgi:hypothetical protein
MKVVTSEANNRLEKDLRPRSLCSLAAAAQP